RTEQTVDTHGNLTQSKVYGWAGGSNYGPLLQTTTNSYLGSANYTSRYIFNRLYSTFVANGSGQGATVLTHNYDQYGSLADTPSIRQHDSSYGTGLIYRGNVTGQTTATKTTSFTYDIAGNATSDQSGSITVQHAPTTATNYYVRQAPRRTTTQT